ncbi:HEPN domain-containing protein [Aliivibrio fischeri]|uniref:HEPN domain-containing protein n=1 Tax=Aliivibrio fischeri TaxID=668 RepID=UPI0012DADF80|nr:HEPN domain-containing protein [Aliivibrio fischeri]MUJ39651.1 hypothetical protein [Aliivibrio fischeri]
MSTEVNYLILFDKKNFQFSGTDTFIKLLNLLDGVTANHESISFKNSTFGFSLACEGDRFENHKTELFDLEIISNKNEKDVENLSLLLREIRIIVSNQKGTITPVFDGVSAFYAEKAYPHIHHIENLMRKLYSKFTLIKLGPQWVDSIPSEVAKPQKKGCVSGSNPLYDMDFITINDLLFKEHPIKEITSDVLKKIKAGSVSSEDIEPYIPTSNWTRYFSELVDCESNYLETRWKKLYDLRNKIAHNKLFTQSDLVDVKKITEDVKSKLLPALTKISTLEVTLIDGPSVSLPQEANAVLEGELCTNELTTVKCESEKDPDLGGLATLALVVGFLAAISRS